MAIQTEDPSDHLFKVGETVQVEAGFGVKPGPAKIVRLMPANRDGQEPQYRVKSETESCERMIVESGVNRVN